VLAMSPLAPLFSMPTDTGVVDSTAPPVATPASLSTFHLEKQSFRVDVNRTLSVKSRLACDFRLGRRLFMRGIITSFP
jgi:hypothetical protein